MRVNTKRRVKLILLGLATLLLALIAWPREDLWLKAIGLDEPLKIRQGLDLQGGAYLVYEAQLDQLGGQEAANRDEIVANAAQVIERRINPGGASETIVQTANDGRIIVQIPGVENPEEAKQVIGQTAKLEFFEVRSQDGEVAYLPTNISGQDVARATVDFTSANSQPVVSLQLKGGQSTAEFADLTNRLAGTTSQLVTLLDNQIVFGPASVQTPITDGQAQLSGSFNAAQAREIANLLNAGALPVPVELVAQQTIGPTLGEQAIKASLVAAAIGLLSVITFLLVNYRLAGVVAVAALIFYALALISLIKLSAFTPYTIVLTLAGIAGFILSIAVAVDGSILFMERIREELASGSSPVSAVSGGFEHAWTSIRDANITTIIGSFILYWYGAPLIKGFALTLGAGVFLNLLTVQAVTKTVMSQLARYRSAGHMRWINITREQTNG